MATLYCTCDVYNKVEFVVLPVVVDADKCVESTGPLLTKTPTSTLLVRTPLPKNTIKPPVDC